MAIASKDIITSYAGRKLKLTNLDKILYPEANYSKADVIQYYLEISPHILSYLKDRPLTVIRFPNGIDKQSFYKKEKPTWTPDWVGSFGIKHTDEEINYLVPNELAVIPWLGNLAALELHPMQSRTADIEHPDWFIYDLDPSEDTPFVVIQELAFKLKYFLERAGHKPFLKTSGSKGLHLLCKMHERLQYDALFVYLKKITQDFVDQNLDVATLKLNKSKRGKKILIDILRNHRHNSTVAAFSLRGKPGAPISWPIRWKTLEQITTSQVVTLANYRDYMDEGIEVMQQFLSDGKISMAGTTPKTNIEESKDLPKSLPKHMLATQQKQVPKGAQYIYEIKWDGIRIFIEIQKGEIKIRSRKGRDITHQFPDVHEAISRIDVDNTILDGEICCMNSKGVPDFSKVISRLHSKSSASNPAFVKSNPAIFFCFDAPYINGVDIRNMALNKRREKIQAILPNNKHVKFSDAFEDGDALYEHGKIAKLEGIMVKDIFSKYEEGKRSASWIKIKYRERALVEIIGYTAGSGDRVNLPGSFHIIERKDDDVIYRGRVGTGFNEQKLIEIKNLLDPHIVSKKPIKQKVDEEKNSVWLDTFSMCEVEYASITNNDTFREPVFISLIEI